MSKEKFTMSVRTMTAAVASVLALLVLGGAPAQASQAVKTFTTSTSNTGAGLHPDLFTSFSLDSPGKPESAKNVLFDAPEGVFGNTNAITKCLPADFALDSCPTNSQAGLITIRANYEGNDNNILGTAPLFNIRPGTETPA